MWRPCRQPAGASRRQERERQDCRRDPPHGALELYVVRVELPRSRRCWTGQRMGRLILTGFTNNFVHQPSSLASAMLKVTRRHDHLPLRSHGERAWTSAHNSEQHERPRASRSEQFRSALECPRARCRPSSEMTELRYHRPPFSRGFVRNYAEEVDLDPDSLVREYFAQFPELAVAPPTISVRTLPDVSWQEPSRWGGMATAVAILLAVVVTAVVLGRRSEPSTEPTPVGTSGESAAPAAPAPADAIDRAVRRQRLRHRHRRQARQGRSPSCSRCHDRAGLPPPSMASARSTEYCRAARPQRSPVTSTIAIRFGDAGAVKWTINGRDPGTPGGAGAVRDIRINLENAATVR